MTTPRDRRAWRIGDPLPDAPALAAPGPYPVGVTTLRLRLPDRPDLSRPDAPADAPVRRAPRALTLEAWYPCGPSPSTGTVYRDRLAGAPPRPFRFRGRARRDAPPLRDGSGTEGGAPYPLVLVSHGYPGSRVMMSYLTEHLASTGFVVVAIDHADSLHGRHQGRFASTLVHRSADQLATLDALDAWSRAPGHPLAGLLDATRTAIVGYSMGGYGALLSAGAGLDPGAAATLADRTGVPRSLLPALTHDDPAYPGGRDPRLRALVAFAPWGGSFGLWSDAALARVGVPALFVAGDGDDVSGYRHGVRRIWAGCQGTDRWLLVYQNARHNVAPNPPPEASLRDAQAFEHYAEPVWDERRINNVNQHVVGAFLRWQLRGESSLRRYLDVPTPRAEDGTYAMGWDLSPVAGEDHWPGFPPRTALGLELWHAPAGRRPRT